MEAEGLNLEMSVTEIGVTEFLLRTNYWLFRQDQELHKSSPPCLRSLSDSLLPEAVEQK